MSSKELLRGFMGFFVLSLSLYLLLFTGEFKFFDILIGQIFFLIIVLFSGLAMKVMDIL